MTTPLLHAEGLSKTFVLHTQGGVRIPVFDALDLIVTAGECVCLDGPSGAGKSTLMRCLYANYRPAAGRVRVMHRGEWADLTGAEPWRQLEIRRETVGYVSQFLRVIPRVPAIEVVMEPARARGVPAAVARDRAADLLARLRIPERLWSLAPATFSGGEQQRVNIARGLIAEHPVLLVDEPTASLDAANRATVVELIRARKAAGAAVVGIFHDAEVRGLLADRGFDVARRRVAA
jgi:alpha-D-ribose 1-methylphosphonate 5-triphosphate synthase subunit PhnL